MSGSGFQITFNTVSGKIYRLECAPALSGPWTVLENNIPGTGSSIQLTDAMTAASTRFYRIRVE